ncbi:hypothetical protein HPB50_022244 [Hyalomma asiaticum]|uniref:Uncharacterized protein n=1 Tax=Hyalomma asiaticum TaxID=266040 RepID=A0ACB7S8S0_HYAAI|nr:hypothetical protein HPB50_022244 [Hyalomma asiaticum]
MTAETYPGELPTATVTSSVDLFTSEEQTKTDHSRYGGFHYDSTEDAETVQDSKPTVDGSEATGKTEADESHYGEIHNRATADREAVQGSTPADDGSDSIDLGSSSITDFPPTQDSRVYLSTGKENITAANSKANATDAEKSQKPDSNRSQDDQQRGGASAHKHNVPAVTVTARDDKGGYANKDHANPLPQAGELGGGESDGGSAPQKKPAQVLGSSDVPTSVNKPSQPESPRAQESEAQAPGKTSSSEGPRSQQRNPSAAAILMINMNDEVRRDSQPDIPRTGLREVASYGGGEEVRAQMIPDKAQGTVVIVEDNKEGKQQAMKPKATRMVETTESKTPVSFDENQEKRPTDVVVETPHGGTRAKGEETVLVVKNATVEVVPPHLKPTKAVPEQAQTDDPRYGGYHYAANEDTEAVQDSKPTVDGSEETGQGITDRSHYGGFHYGAIKDLEAAQDPTATYDSSDSIGTGSSSTELKAPVPAAIDSEQTESTWHPHDTFDYGISEDFITDSPFKENEPKAQRTASPVERDFWKFFALGYHSTDPAAKEHQNTSAVPLQQQTNTFSTQSSYMSSSSSTSALLFKARADEPPRKPAEVPRNTDGTTSANKPSQPESPRAQETKAQAPGETRSSPEGPSNLHLINLTNPINHPRNSNLRERSFTYLSLFISLPLKLATYKGPRHLINQLSTWVLRTSQPSIRSLTPATSRPLTMLYTSPHILQVIDLPFHKPDTLTTMRRTHLATVRNNAQSTCNEINLHPEPMESKHPLYAESEAARNLESDAIGAEPSRRDLEGPVPPAIGSEQTDSTLRLDDTVYYRGGEDSITDLPVFEGNKAKVQDTELPEQKDIWKMFGIDYDSTESATKEQENTKVAQLHQQTDMLSAPSPYINSFSSVSEPLLEARADDTDEIGLSSVVATEKPMSGFSDSPLSSNADPKVHESSDTSQSQTDPSIMPAASETQEGAAATYKDNVYEGAASPTTFSTTDQVMSLPEQSGTGSDGMFDEGSGVTPVADFTGIPNTRVDLSTRKEDMTTASLKSDATDIKNSEKPDPNRRQDGQRTGSASAGKDNVPAVIVTARDDKGGDDNKDRANPSPQAGETWSSPEGPRSEQQNPPAAAIPMINKNNEGRTDSQPEIPRTGAPKAPASSGAGDEGRGEKIPDKAQETVVIVEDKKEGKEQAKKPKPTKMVENTESETHISIDDNPEKNPTGVVAEKSHGAKKDNGEDTVLVVKNVTVEVVPEADTPDSKPTKPVPVVPPKETAVYPPAEVVNPPYPPYQQPSPYQPYQPYQPSPYQQPAGTILYLPQPVYQPAPQASYVPGPPPQYQPETTEGGDARLEYPLYTEPEAA